MWPVMDVVEVGLTELFDVVHRERLYLMDFLIPARRANGDWFLVWPGSQ